MMRSFGKRIALLVAFSASLTIWSAAALGQSYPNRPIRMIMPYVAGGSGDMIGRIVAQEMMKLLGQQVIVDNRPGAGGRIGIEATSTAQSDGYTIGFGSLSTLSIAPSLYKNLPYNPIKSFEPISMVGSAPFLVVVNSSVPANSLRQLVELEKSNPGKLNYGSNGAGTVLHFFGEHFNEVTGSKIFHVPYKSSGPALVALLAGDVQVMFDQLASFQLPNIQSGKLRALAVTGPARLPQLPNVPTAAEAGFPGLEESVWFGLIAPAGTPKEVVRLLNAIVTKALAAKELVEILTHNGLILGGGTPEEFAATIKNDTDKWANIVKSTGFKPE